VRAPAVARGLSGRMDGSSDLLRLGTGQWVSRWTPLLPIMYKCSVIDVYLPKVYIFVLLSNLTAPMSIQEGI
jgi:hypothetical protein